MSSYSSATHSSENDKRLNGITAWKNLFFIPLEGRRGNERKNFRGGGRGKQNPNGRINNDVRYGEREGKDERRTDNKRMQEEKSKIEQFIRNNTKPSPLNRESSRPGNEMSQGLRTESRPETSTPGSITADNVVQKSSLLFTLWQSTQKVLIPL
jgi:hypothetical protein